MKPEPLIPGGMIGVVQSDQPGSDLFLFTDLRDELALYLDEDQVAQITDAYLTASAAHAGQLRESGEPYITHPVEVARILSKMRLEPEVIMAGLLHDVLEDTSITLGYIRTHFSALVAQLVDGVSKLQQIHFESREERQAENFRKMVLAMVRDIRVILIKLADRLHNMRTLQVLNSGRRVRIARETLDIYAPIANRLGMNHFKIELEDLGFAALYPLRYRILREQVLSSRRALKEGMLVIQKTFRQALADAGIAVERIDGREKNLYSIYKKMRNKHVSFREIMDVYAFRIMVENTDACYRVLGVVHSLYKPVPGRFKDYIAIPKINGYQSLHTTLFGPQGFPIEIQIRTGDMHRMAEQGIASHWLYKTDSRGIDLAQIQASPWLKELMELQRRSGDSLEFIENFKFDVFPDEIYVFTPKGEIMELPTGASAVDFAYAVHTDIGNTCVAVKLNRRLAPLSTVLATGQTVEIVTSPGARPNPAWLRFVVTGKAKSHIRHFLKNQQKAESIRLGRRLIESALASLYDSHDDTIPPAVWTQVAHALQYPHLDDLLESVGLGNRMAWGVAQHMDAIYQGIALAPACASASGMDRAPKSAPPLPVFGTEGMVVQFARCCWPIPGDPIVGVQTSGQGLMVHTSQCRHVVHMGPQLVDTCVHLQWAEHLETTFLVALRVETLDQRGILSVIAGHIASAQADIESVRSHDKEGGKFADLFFVIAVRNRDHLARVMRRLRTVKAITKMVRVR